MPELSFIPSAEISDVADDVRQIFEELATTLPGELRAGSGECRPPLDVCETDSGIEVVVDLSGVPPQAVRIVFRAGILVIAGEKAPPRPREPQAFHLVEREFGRFARGVRVSGAFDIQRAHATFRNGELIVVLPKRVDRRGARHVIPVAQTDRSA